MPRCLPIAPHLPQYELATRSRHRRNPVERRHGHIVWLVAQGHRGPAVARRTGYAEDWLRMSIHRSNADGPVAAWMAERLGRPVGPQRGWEAMRTLGVVPQRPRPRATNADPVAQAAFNKGGSRRRSTP